MYKKYILTIVLAIIVVVLGFYSINANGKRQKIDYQSSLDKLAVTVNESKLTLKDLAFYVAYEEYEVENQAHVYNPDNTNKYWNTHIDGEFVRITARDSAMQMAVHDEIFFQMAVEEGVKLTDEEKNYVRNTVNDFKNDMEDYGQLENLDIDIKVYEDTIEKIALAQKYQEIYAELKGHKKSDYDFENEKYKKLLKNNKYKINKSIWERIEMGNITLRH